MITPISKPITTLTDTVDNMDISVKKQFRTVWMDQNRHSIRERQKRSCEIILKVAGTKELKIR